MRAPLSARQREVLRLIVHFYRATGEPPSERYLARRLGLHRTVVQEHLAALYRKGWLRTPSPTGLYCTHVP